MRVSSATASLESQPSFSRSSHETGAAQASVWPQIKHYFHKLDRMMTAIAYAEAGNLDAVQKILDENKSLKNLARHPVANGGMDWQ